MTLPCDSGVGLLSSPLGHDLSLASGTFPTAGSLGVPFPPGVFTQARLFPPRPAPPHAARSPRPRVQSLFTSSTTSHPFHAVPGSGEGPRWSCVHVVGWAWSVSGRRALVCLSTSRRLRFQAGGTANPQTTPSLGENQGCPPATVQQVAPALHGGAPPYLLPTVAGGGRTGTSREDAQPVLRLP